jgi:hypothetical protein
VEKSGEEEKLPVAKRKASAAFRDAPFSKQCFELLDQTFTSDGPLLTTLSISRTPN